MYRGDDGSVSHVERKVNSVKSVIFRQCGYCINCRLTRAQNWAIRMTHESQFHEQNSFLTLTYSDDRLPPGGSLHYEDVTKFIKRLRRRLDSTFYKNSLTFYRVGEYGTDYQRPHYHLVLFGFDFSEPLVYRGVRNTRTISSQSGDRTYFKSTFASDLWDRGFVDVGKVDFATCMYTAKYVTKKLNNSVPHNSPYGVLEAEKASMSKRVPIGLRWIQKFYRDVYPHDFVILNGKRYQPPSFYDDWLSKNHPSLYSEVKRSREDSMRDSFSDTDYQSLHASHFIAVQRQKSFLRDGCAPNLSVDQAMLERKLDIINSISKGEIL